MILCAYMRESKKARKEKKEREREQPFRFSRGYRAYEQEAKPSLIARFLAFFSRSAALADGMRARRVTARDPVVHGVRHGYTRTYSRANTYSVNLSGAHTWRRRDHQPHYDVRVWL